MTTLDRYRLLGRTGLRVSPLSLGTMTFGSGSAGSGSAGSGSAGTGSTGPGSGWTIGPDDARAIFDRYLDAGGNFIDTADVYAGGQSEELIGAFARGIRDRLVIATKFGGPTDRANVAGRGNGRKHIMAALEASLRRLGTDYVDLYWLHMWDSRTPVEEVMATFAHLVQSGKVRFAGLSNVPAWYAARAQTLACATGPGSGAGPEPIAGLQLPYSLVERGIETEHIPAARELGMGLVPWSPLAYGFLSGKYDRPPGTAETSTGTGSGSGQNVTGSDVTGSDVTGRDVTGRGRLTTEAEWPDPRVHGDREWAILDEVRSVAAELACSPARVAIAWALNRPAVSSVILGATSVAQLDDNLAAWDLELTPEQLARLDSVSAPAPGPLDRFFAMTVANDQIQATP